MRPRKTIVCLLSKSLLVMVMWASVEIISSKITPLSLQINKNISIWFMHESFFQISGSESFPKCQMLPKCYTQICSLYKLTSGKSQCSSENTATGFCCFLNKLPLCSHRCDFYCTYIFLVNLATQWDQAACIAVQTSVLE